MRKTTQTTTVRPIATVAALIIGVAGTGVALAEAPKDRGSDNAADTPRALVVTETSTRLALATVEGLTGVPLENRNGTSLGEISDLMIDQSTGRIVYAIADIGGFIGIGEKTISIPYHEVRWSDDDERAIVDLTKEQADRAPEFDPTRTDIESDAWRAELESIYGWIDWDENDDDPFLNELSDRDTVEVEGSVVQVDRSKDVRGDTQVVVTIRTRDGAEQRVALGPPDHVMGATNPPMRGDWAAITAYEVERESEDDARLIAQSYTSGKQTLTLRDANGNGAWLSGDTSRSEASERRFTRFALADSLLGDTVKANLETVGEVQELIFDRVSGTLAFLALDPNENFLGMGDTLRLIPWPTVAAIGDDTVSLDATNSMINGALEFKGDLDEINSFERIDFSYRVFSVEPSQLEVDREDVSDSPRRVVPSDSMWARDGVIERQLRNVDAKTLSGAISRVHTDRIADDEMKTLVVDIETARGMRSVCLGPAAMLDRERLNLADGKPIEVKASKIEMDVRTLYVAKEIRLNGQWTTLRPWAGE